jgi:hypothetical protein
MMRLRRASAIATLVLLAWATTASAECAWVLWGAYEDPRALVAARQYRPLKALTQGATECEAERGRYKSGQGWVDFVCLPDTVDPRGPKGK